MGDHEHGSSFVCKGSEVIEYGFCIFRIEVACRFVGEEELGSGQQRSGTLCCSPTPGGWQMVPPVNNELFEQIDCPLGDAGQGLGAWGKALSNAPK